MKDANKLRVQEGRDDMPIFIHRELDDYGLTCVEFRVYGRVARRAGCSGEHLESAARMAREFGVSEATVRRALKLLVLCNLVSKEIRPGKTSIYRLQPKRMWVAKGVVPAMRERVLYREDEESDVPARAAAPLSPETGVVLSPEAGVSGGSPVTRDGRGVSPETGVVLSPETDEGTPIRYSPEGTPRHTHTPASSAPARSGDEAPCVCDSVKPDDLTEDDYYAYARSQPTLRTPDVWAAGHWDRRDRDKMVRDWKERQRPEVIEEARRAPPDKRLALAYARQLCDSLARTGHDVGAYIDTLDVSDEHRRRLHEEFPTPSGAAHTILHPTHEGAMRGADQATDSS